MTAKLPTWRLGTAYKNGKYYSFEQAAIIVLTSWPDPRAYRRTKTKPWAQVRNRANEVFGHFHMELPEENLVEYFLRSVVDQNLRQVPRSEHGPPEPRRGWPLITSINQIFSPSFPWPDGISQRQQLWIKGGANGLLVDSQYLHTIPKEIRHLLSPFRERSELPRLH